MDDIVSLVRKKKIDVLLLTRYTHRTGEFWNKLKKTIDFINHFIPVLIIDVNFPSITKKREYSGNVFILKDAAIMR